MKRRKERFGDPRKRSKKHRGKNWFDHGLKNRQLAMTHEEMLANPQIPQHGLVKIEGPTEMVEVDVIKEVPAMHTGLPGGEHEGEKVEVGTAIIHSDRSVALRYHDDAPLWAMEEIQAFADKVGYSLGTGEPNGRP